jgi:hypothetical protein
MSSPGRLVVASLGEGALFFPIFFNKKFFACNNQRQPVFTKFKSRDLWGVTKVIFNST